jgi:predicted short-subunit dehydrogenase-like oxidoreductase (DUF2520 family)
MAGAAGSAGAADGLNTEAQAMRKTLNIIGCGKVGKVLGRLWSASGSLVVQDVLNRSIESAEQAVAFMGCGNPVGDYKDLHPADVYLIAVSDDQIRKCCDALARSGKLSPHAIVFHCSGALGSDELRSAQEQGAVTASVHPIRSFAAPEQVAATFTGTYCGMEGDRQALDVLHAAFSSIGALTVRIEADSKIIYHSAAVFACNYLVTLMDLAQQAYVKSGIPPELALKLMEPLVRETVDNVFRSGPVAALTGPIARGDAATVVRQYRAVRAWNKRYGLVYKLLGKLTSALNRRRFK